jgi:hypothetical protein
VSESECARRGSGVEKRPPLPYLYRSPSRAPNSPKANNPHLLVTCTVPNTPSGPMRVRSVLPACGPRRAGPALPLCSESPSLRDPASVCDWSASRASVSRLSPPLPLSLSTTHPVYSPLTSSSTIVFVGTPTRRTRRSDRSYAWLRCSLQTSRRAGSGSEPDGGSPSSIPYTCCAQAFALSSTCAPIRAKAVWGCLSALSRDLAPPDHWAAIGSTPTSSASGSGVTNSS